MQQVAIDPQHYESFVWLVKLTIALVMIGIGKDVVHFCMWIQNRVTGNHERADPRAPLTLGDAKLLLATLPNTVDMTAVVGETKATLISCFQEVRLELMRGREVAENSREKLIDLLATEKLRYELELKKLQVEVSQEVAERGRERVS